MNDRDRDLIISLIEGSLGVDDAAAASARIAADPELSAEYASQRKMAETLSAMPAVSLTETERSTLRANLVGELNLTDPAPAPVSAGSSGRAWWWRPALALGSVAAVFFIGVTVVPEMFSSSDDAGDAFTAALETETTLATSEAGDGGADAAEDAAGASIDESRTDLLVPSLRSPDLDKILDSIEGESSPEAIEEGTEMYASDPSLEIDLDDVHVCREKLGNAIPDGEIRVLGAEEGDQGPIVTVVFVDGEGVTGAARIELASCVLIDLAE